MLNKLKKCEEILVIVGLNRIDVLGRYGLHVSVNSE